MRTARDANITLHLAVRALLRMSSSLRLFFRAF